MAEFNLQYYCGTDYYSDGDVEKRIEDAIKSNKEWVDIVKEADEKDRYTFIYHLSPIRENILNWYNFKDDAEVLEIGSGLGAITGALCKRAKKVVSVELSKRRAGINFARHKDLENLEIIVGNLNDLPVDKKYDYIVLNGVFEYAASFTKGDNPYEIFLNNVLQYLKKDGVLLVAIENRLGIKYFAGAVEDHTDRSFLGIDHYKDVDNVKTFSKSEIDELFQSCGLDNTRFYYPYPDYKFPLEVFTDETVNNGSYGRKCHYFERYNKRLFDATGVCKTFANEGIMANFANSFLIEASAETLKNEVVIYTKLNGFRKKETAIGTSIFKSENGEKKVVKYALSDAANSHIETLYHNTTSSEYYLQGDKKENAGILGVEYPFVSEKPLSVLANKYIKNNQWSELTELLIKVSGCLLPNGEKVKNKDIYSDNFIRWFVGECVGKERSERENIERENVAKENADKEWDCVKNCNIDLILDNIYDLNGKFTVIDCEWCPEFYVPKKFIVWRMINELFYQNHLSAESEFWKKLMLEFEIDEDEELLFRKWAVFFANEFVNDSRVTNECVDESVCDVTKLMQSKSITRIAQLYLDFGQGLSEENKLWKNFEIEQDGRFQIEFSLIDYHKIKGLRYDPIEKEYITCSDMEFFINDKKVKYSDSNMEKKSKGVFLNDDPQFWFKKVPSKAESFKVVGKIKIRKS